MSGGCEPDADQAGRYSGAFSPKLQRACLVGGTAWLFSREELAGRFDYPTSSVAFGIGASIVVI